MTFAPHPLQPMHHIDCWIFDLDNTLYPPSADIFGQIDVKMGQFIQRMFDCDAVEARTIQKRYFHDHGTTLSGLMHHHAMEPSAFLDYVHDVDLEVLSPDPVLHDALAQLPGRRLVFTNGDGPYAQRVLHALGIAHLFEGIHDIIACNYVPKPQQSAYDTLLRDYRVTPETSLFVEDMAVNLAPAKAMGMHTVWINNGSERGDHNVDKAWIDEEISHIGDWLTHLTENRL